MTTKGARYVEQLDDARCEGTWSEVPELVRKVRKHLPARECIAVTAEAECAISKVTTGGSRPSAAATARDLDVSNRVTQLEAAIEAETVHDEDRFQAQVCLGWLHWVVGEYELALRRLPENTAEAYPNMDPADTVSEWTSVCALKAAYLRANCHMREGQRAQSLAALRAGQVFLARVWGGHGIRKQLRYWSELFLTEHCMLSSEALHGDEAALDDPDSIACFRSWSRYWEVMAAPVAGGFGFKGSVPRRRIWSEYYLVLSRIVDNDLSFPSDNLGTDMSARSQLRVELRRAESAYQALLLSETTFPRADEERAEVEAFVKQVMMNWAVLCGRGWSERDLGEGGRQGVSRGVLDILYGAATRTYHSTAILRSLFTVHLAVAEFDLALKALDSYLEIVRKGRARVEKTGHPEPGLDDDGTVMDTTAQAVLILCRHGHHKAVDRARQLAAELEEWLGRLPQARVRNHDGDDDDDGSEAETEARSRVPPQTVALAWQAVGLAQAQWSRTTSDAGSRAEVQSKAIRSLRRSLAPELGRSKDVRSLFGLALLLAERRELAAAVELVRTSLIASQGYEEDYNLLYGPYWLERSLVPMWHLLALLLSARQDYAMAARACEGAVEQFKDQTVLFGRADGHFRSEHLNDNAGQGERGLVDDMDDGEKEAILDVKMTQLALIELREGPDAAVNASYELLTLFGRLFGSVGVQPMMQPAVQEPPKTSATFRTIKGSIFGSHRVRPATRQPTATLGTNSDKSTTTTTLPTRPGTSHTVAASGGDPEAGLPRSRSGSVGQPRQRSGSARRNSLKKKQQRHDGDNRARSSSAGTSHAAVDGASNGIAGTDGGHDFFSSAGRRLQSRIAHQRGRALSSLTAGISEELTAEATTLPSALPLVQFSAGRARNHRTGILVRVWLMIAGFYRRAEMVEEGQEAASEAQRLVMTMGDALGGEGEGGSGVLVAEKVVVDELWADVYTELGQLALAKEAPYSARRDFESALTHSPNHAAAIVGLSNILLDLYCEKLLPTPTVPPLDGREGAASDPAGYLYPEPCEPTRSLPSTPLGLGCELSVSAPAAADESDDHSPVSGDGDGGDGDDAAPAPYKATRLPLMDRLAARDRAHGLLTGLTRLGTGWDCSEAWVALARAHEENGQLDKAREVLWWCVELEEARGVRGWRCLAGGSYVS